MNNILIKGGPGTGKTITARAMAYYLCHKKYKIEDVYSQDILADIKDIETFVKSDFVEFIQIHPSMSYEDIVYGIEVKPCGSINMAYAEKRVKFLCDCAIGKSDLYCIIMDDICRANTSSLLGNLLYAMEYRNQPVDLADGNTMIIPDNVLIIITECEQLYGNGLEYALRRRFDYVKELISDKQIIDKYYDKCLTINIKQIVLDVYGTIHDFVTGHILNDPNIRVSNYMPGHGMLMVDRAGTQADILENIKLKFIYQIYPYIVDMKMAGIITGDTQGLYDDVCNQINVGSASLSKIVSVSKELLQAATPASIFDLVDSKQYYDNTIIPGGCSDHRTVVECIVDAIVLNGVLPLDLAFSDILTNTNIVQFTNRSRTGMYAAFIVEENECMEYGYIRPTFRSYYSPNPQKNKGRWIADKDAPVYKFTYRDGTSKRYISLNAFRNASANVTSKVIHAEENTASIYSATYLLAVAYLKSYENYLSLLVVSDSTYDDICHLAHFERLYLELVNDAAQKLSGDARLKYMCEGVSKLRLLWGKKGNILVVDANLFSGLKSGTIGITEQIYLDLYKTATVQNNIEIKGVGKMASLNNYQQIMENIGVRQMIFQGPPGTSKTFESKRFVLKQLNSSSTVLGKSMPTQEEISKELEAYKLTDGDYANPAASSKLSTGGWDLVQFHPSYGYEDFIRGIEVKPVGGAPTYSSVNRILGKIAEFAKLAEKSTTTGNNPKFYLIIDEINRANLATVFGELIYGLEYRDSCVSTPYEVNDKVSGSINKDIVLGKNLFIVGTMNTADKSIDSIDYAIRRRFIFIDSPANRDVVVNCYKNTMGVSNENSIELLLFDAVGKLFDDDRFFNDEYQKSDVKLGHTYFLRTSATGYLDTAIERFVFQVVPILREYVKDGILDTIENLTSLEHTVSDINSAPDKAELLSENIMMMIKYYGDKNSAGKLIDNQYIADFITELCTILGY